MCHVGARDGAGSSQGACASWPRSSYPCCSSEDMAMRQSSDLSPLYRASIGFDRLFEVLRAALEQTAEPAWPYYDILKYSDDRYRLRMAVPGFTDADLEVTQSDNVLTVKGRRSDDGEGEFLYRSLPQEDFEH